MGHAVDQRVTGDGGGRGEDQRHDETHRIGDRSVANRTANTPNAIAAAIRPMKLAPIRPAPV